MERLLQLQNFQHEKKILRTDSHNITNIEIELGKIRQKTKNPDKIASYMCQMISSSN